MMMTATSWAAPGDVVTDLSQLSNNKSYIISTPVRGTLVVDNRGFMSTTEGTDAKGYGYEEATMKFAIINVDGTYYLYNVAKRCFFEIRNDGWTHTTENKGITITFDDSHANGDYKYMIYSGGLCMNSNGGSNIQFLTYNNPDDGNRWMITEADDFDATDVVNFIRAVDVTYNIYFNGQKLTSTVAASIPVNSTPSLQAPDFCSYTYDVQTITSDVTEVNATLVWNGPFAISNSFADAHWYNLDIRDDYHFVSYAPAMESNVRAIDKYQIFSSRAQFAFTGNPLDGFKVLNKAAGENFAAQYTNESIMVMSENSADTWKVYNPGRRGDYGFVLKAGTNTWGLNEQNGQLKAWGGTDDGSTFTVKEVDNSIIADGYYRMKAKRDGAGYIGLDDKKLDVSFSGTEIGSILKMESNADNLTSIQVQGKYIGAPAACGTSDTPVYMDYVKVYNDPKITFQNVDGNDYHYLHCGVNSNLTGWVSGDGASFWDIEEVNSIDVTISAAGYATLNVGFPLEIPTNVTAYTGTVEGENLKLTELSGVIPANTPVILEGAEGNYTFSIAKGNTDASPEQDMLGSLLSVTQDGESAYYALGKKNGQVGFYKMAEGNAIPSNKAYLRVSANASVKGFAFMTDADTETGINGHEVNSSESSSSIYNLNGQQISKVQRGVNIINGKKIIK